MFSITEKGIGSINNDPVVQYTITNSNGMRVSILNYGATVSEIITPDKYGNFGDVVLGFKSLDGFLQDSNPYFGSLVGRFCNRIANASFTLDGKTYMLAANNNGNALHGGIKGFDKVIWKANVLGNNQLQMSYLSPDGEEGYPGNLLVDIIYTLTENNEFRMEYKAVTDKPTPINLTNHSYFNLSAEKQQTILNHILKINAEKYLEVDETSIPTGIIDVKGSGMDFTNAKPIGQDIDKVKGGYDHNYILIKPDEGAAAASLYDPESGRYMEVFTTEPGLQFYSANNLDGTLKDTKADRKYIKHGAVCLEAQHFPDSPNQPSFPNTILRPGETYKQVTVYKFGTR
ncbi:MAG TPA: aldose epimerase family protein [Sphingobacteriaceae bacterium]